jgi:acyl-CoA synthetase (NDP forming)/RimJ/RimL family protein N-acetyltransferase
MTVDATGRITVDVDAAPGALGDVLAVGVDALTSDGGIVRIRRVTGADRDGLTALYARASSDSLRLRFFVQPSLAALASDVDRLCAAPNRRHAAVVADFAGTLVGVASYERTDEVSRRAEFAVFVDDAHRGHGIGTLLLEHLADLACTQGIAELTGEVLPGNIRMLHVARDLTARVWSRVDDGVIDVGFDTRVGEAAQLAVDVRERAAEHASLRPLLMPASVAVVGAGHLRGGVGHETLRALHEGEFTGLLYAVNRHAAMVDGLPAYRCVADLPAPIDLLVIAVPANQVAGVLADAAGIGVRAAVVLSSGFGEAGPQGRARQHEVVRTARARGIRLVGPNCLGVINTDPAVRLNASFGPTAPLPGGLAVAAQSGAVGIAVLEHAARSGHGISTFVSLGNKADVSGNDLIAYWFDDPATTAIALYLESFGNPRKFGRTVRALSRRKPVLAVKSGRSTAGRRAGASHTAAAAAPDATVDALFAQAGVIRADSLGEMLDAAQLLTDQPLPKGSRLGIIGNAGGLNVLAADAAEAAGLTVPAWGAATGLGVSTAAPGAASDNNPLDLGAAATPAAFAAAVQAVAASGEVDALLLVLVGTRANVPAGILAALGSVVDANPDLTVATVIVGTPDGEGAPLGERHVPVFDLPERAATALGHAARYAAWRREPLGYAPQLAAVDHSRARRLIDAALAHHTGWQPYDVTRAVLSAYGIPVLASTTVHDLDGAVGAAEEFGYPVVIKSADPLLVHKSDTGGVQVGLMTPTAVRSAYQAVTRAGLDGCGALVQPQLPSGLELVAGIVHDPLFGAVVMVGLGGVHTDLLDDRALRLVPMTDLDAGRMWRSLRGAPLLTGYRGSSPVDTAAVEDLLLRLAQLADHVPEIAELDLNPVIASPDGVLAVDAKMRIAAIGAEPSPTLRRLR